MPPKADPTKTDARLTAFIQKYDTMKDRRLPLHHPTSPFSTYLKKQFEDGLRPIDKARLNLFQEQGRCFEVDKLVIKGFMQLYPFLKPAFDDHIRGRKLKLMIDLRYKPPSYRCSGYRDLNEFKRYYRFEDYAPIDMRVDIPLKRKKRAQGLTKTPRGILVSAYLRLGNTAFCYDYPRAIEDILIRANKRGGLQLTPEEEHYLIERAYKYKVYKTSDYETALELLKSKYQKPNDFGLIQRAGKQGKIKDVPGFWRKACAVLRQM